MTRAGRYPVISTPRRKCMKIVAVVLALAVLMVGVPAWADSVHVGDTTTINNNPTANANAAAASSASSSASSNPVQVNTQINSQSTHVSQGQDQYQGQGQVQGQTYEGQQNTSVSVKTDVPRQAPPAVPAALAVSSLTCYGSWSVAASTPFGGVGAGFPTKDADCERSRNALILVNLGLRDAALALLAQNEDTAKALKAAKISYPGQVAEAPATVQVAAAVSAPAPVVAPAITAADAPACGDGKPAVLKGWRYDCPSYR